MKNTRRSRNDVGQTLVNAAEIDAKPYLVTPSFTRNQETPIKMLSVESSMVNAIGYDEDNEDLFLEYNSGDTYRYPMVSAARFIKILNAPSVGHAIHEYILQRQIELGVQLGEKLNANNFEYVYGGNVR